VTQRSEQLRLEAEKLRADSDRKSKRTMDDAQRRADDLIAEAKAQAERIRGESERELAAATQRRDSINAQLTNVRQMLATLTGASLPDPLADEQPEQPAAQKPAQPAAAAGDAGKGAAPAGAAKPAGPPSNVIAAEGDKAAGAKPAGDQPAGDKPQGHQVADADTQKTVTTEKPQHTNR
jgi:hypothetical protein